MQHNVERNTVTFIGSRSAEAFGSVRNACISRTLRNSRLRLYRVIVNCQSANAKTDDASEGAACVLSELRRHARQTQLVVSVVSSLAPLIIRTALLGVEDDAKVMTSPARRSDSIGFQRLRVQEMNVRLVRSLTA